jgi:protein involved in polysaccharide export with SLBB domain
MKNRIVLLEVTFALLLNLSGANAQTAVAPRAQPVTVPPQGQPSAVAPQAQSPTVAPQAPAVVPQAQSSSTLDNYILSPNDIILVKVFEDPDLDSQHRISQDGTINFPLIGVVQISGRTVTQAANTIRERLLKGYLRNPQVRVNVIEYASRRITILGQVGRPGSYLLPNEEHVDLLEAIAMAGGFTRLADEGRVLVRRNVNGVETILKVNVHAETKNSSSQLFEVQPDDKITVRERIF